MSPIYVFHFHWRILMFVLIIPLFCIGQGVVNPFSSLKGKRDFIYGIDNRRTHIKEQSTVIYGVYVGLGFDKKLRFKLGVSGTPFEVGRTQDAWGNVTRHRLVFLTLGEEFDFFIKNRFRLTTYIQSGVGYDYTRMQLLDGSSVVLPRRTIVLIELGVNFSYDFFPWLRAKLGGGWRFVLPEHSRELSGYYMKLGVGFSLSRFKEQVLQKD